MIKIRGILSLVLTILISSLIFISASQTSAFPGTVYVLDAPTCPIIDGTSGAASSAVTMTVEDIPDPWAWGWRGEGELGDGITTPPVQNTPVQVRTDTGLNAVKIIAAGWDQSLALNSDGTVWTFGGNEHGQLGDGTTENRPFPVQVIDGNDLTGFLQKIVAISGGGSYSLALKLDGSVWAWGFNNAGQLGNGDDTWTESHTPVRVVDPSDPSGYLSDIIAIDAGAASSLALKSDGTVWAWGWGDSGRLGNGFEDNINVAIQVNNLSGIKAISAGFDHCLALTSDGIVWAWGMNDHGQLGEGTNTGRFFPVCTGFSGVDQISAGGAHSLALKADGTIWAWGSNEFGQLGVGNNSDSSIPLRIFSLDDIEAISAGYDDSLVTKSDDTLWAWGHNNAGQLGIGNYADQNLPVQIAGFKGTTGISAGDGFSLAIGEGNLPPVLDPIGDKTIDEGELLTFTISATDPDDADTLTYTATGLPDGASFNDADRQFSWVPRADQSGSYDVHFEVSDGILTDDEDIVITVNDLTPDSSRLWFLDSEHHSPTYILEKTIGGQTGNAAVPPKEENVNGAAVWLTDVAARGNVGFPPGTWVIHLETTEDWLDNCLVSLGSWDPHRTTDNFQAFPADPPLKSWADGILTIQIVTSTSSPVSNEDYLALKVENSSINQHSITTDGDSDLVLPEDSPDFPLPELSAGILLILGLIGLIGYFSIKRIRQQGLN